MKIAWQKLAELEKWQHQVRAEAYHDLCRTQEVYNMLMVARCMITAALHRKESRLGQCHYRLDFPETDDHNWLGQIAVNRAANGRIQAELVPLMDLDARFRVMDAFDDYIQVISIASPPIYSIASAEVTAELCRIANDELAALVEKYPDRFAAGIACLPLTDIEAAVTEAERAVKDLRLRAVEFYTNINGKPLDAPEFMPVYKTMHLVCFLCDFVF